MEKEETRKTEEIVARMLLDSDLDPFYQNIPEQTRESLALYLSEGLETGGFLKAVLSNDLRGAMHKADRENRETLYQLSSFIFNHAPASSHGSPEKVTQWIKDKRAEMTAKAENKPTWTDFDSSARIGGEPDEENESGPGW